MAETLRNQEAKDEAGQNLYLLFKLPGAHILDFSNGFSSQVLQMFVKELPTHLPPSFLSDHWILTVSCSGTSAGLLLGDLICKQAIAYHQVAFRDVKAFFSNTGGDQEVESALAEIANCILLLLLQEKYA